jgi:hypothetical protein
LFSSSIFAMRRCLQMVRVPKEFYGLVRAADFRDNAPE